uniref:Uncharacterized protein n=1 Tax=Arundo donax TaxID=35708 RepID=A0A0A8XNB4_ARUDO
MDAITSLKQEDGNTMLIHIRWYNQYSCTGNRLVGDYHLHADQRGTFL